MVNLRSNLILKAPGVKIKIAGCYFFIFSLWNTYASIFWQKHLCSSFSFVLLIDVF